jgi:predicted transcriptional regulator
LQTAVIWCNLNAAVIAGRVTLKRGLLGVKVCYNLTEQKVSAEQDYVCYWIFTLFSMLMSMLNIIILSKIKKKSHKRQKLLCMCIK